MTSGPVPYGSERRAGCPRVARLPGGDAAWGSGPSQRSCLKRRPDPPGRTWSPAVRLARALNVLSGAALAENPGARTRCKMDASRRSGLSVSAPRTSRRGCFRAAMPESPNSSTMTSKVHRSPRWLQNRSRPSMSNGAPSNSLATCSTSEAGTNRNGPNGSTKCQMSQGQVIQ
jgi:hypothetical protein